MRPAIAMVILALVLIGCAGGGGGAPQPAAPAAPPAAKPAEPAKPAAPAPAAPAKQEPAKPAAQPAKPAAQPAKPAAEPAKPAAAQFSFRLGWSTGLTHPSGLMAQAFKSEVEKNSNGRVQIQLFPSGQLGGELEMVKATQAGHLDMGSLVATTSASLSPALNLGMLPYYFPDRAAVRKVLDSEAGEMALRSTERNGVKALAWGEVGYNGLLGHRKPVKVVDDAKGMKIRVVENPLFVGAWRALGANPVPMAWPEVYPALQQKTIDAVDTTYVAMTDAKLYEVTKYLALTDQTYFPNLLLMNLTKWQSLPPDLQKIFLDGAKVGAVASRKAGEKADDEAIELIKKQGVEVTQLPREQLRASMKAVYDDFTPRIGVDIMAKAQAAMGSR